MIPRLNNGIEALFKGRSIKFYKGANGLPPACGTSQAKKSFYQQPLIEDAFAAKLVAIYNITKDGVLLGLELACPKGVVKDFETPEVHWSIPVPHPATTQSTENRYERGPDDLNDIKRKDDEDEGDLDISLGEAGNE
jgi:hypothetical protein